MDILWFKKLTVKLYIDDFRWRIVSLIFLSEWLHSWFPFLKHIWLNLTHKCLLWKVLLLLLQKLFRWRLEFFRVWGNSIHEWAIKTLKFFIGQEAVIKFSTRFVASRLLLLGLSECWKLRLRNLKFVRSQLSHPCLLHWNILSVTETIFTR